MFIHARSHDVYGRRGTRQSKAVLINVEQLTSCTSPFLQVAAANGEVIITNDGATILQKMTVTQPAAKMLVELSKSQVCKRVAQ